VCFTPGDYRVVELIEAVVGAELVVPVVVVVVVVVVAVVVECN
jgi:hypothetical protein